MTPLRFRGWNIDNKEMDNFGDYLYWFEERGIASEKEIGIYGWVIMQSTGLKDKNGVEIFEGDIVADRFPAGEDIGEVKWGNFYDMDGEYYPQISGHHVQWHKKCYAPSDETFTDHLLGQVKALEVIGNIYENPELLPAAK